MVPVSLVGAVVAGAGGGGVKVREAKSLVVAVSDGATETAKGSFADDGFVAVGAGEAKGSKTAAALRCVEEAVVANGSTAPNTEAGAGAGVKTGVENTSLSNKFAVAAERVDAGAVANGSTA